MIHSTIATFPLEGGKVAAFVAGGAVAAAHAVLTLRTAGELGAVAGLPRPAALAEMGAVGAGGDRAGFGG